MITIATLTPNIGLHTTPASNKEKKVLDWRTEIAGDGPESNMMIIDAVIKELQDNKANKVNGKVPADELPSYVDDVLEFELYSQLPVVGEQGKIYVVYGDTAQLNGQYRWTGTVYASISNQIDFATQQEAEAGEDNSKAMTALRTKQQIDSLKNKPNGVAGTGADSKVLTKYLPTNLMTYEDEEIGGIVPVDADTLGGKSLTEIELSIETEAGAAEQNAKAASRPNTWLPMAKASGKKKSGKKKGC